MAEKKPLLLNVPNGTGTALPQFHPIHLPPPTPTLLRPESEHSEEELQEIRFRRRAQKWPCGSCTFFLGICHLLSGFTLLAFDVATNDITQTPFGVSAALAFIICAIFSFIAARRIDTAAQLLLVIFSILSLFICIMLFIQSATKVNNLCDEIFPKNCYIKSTIIYIILLCISLIEATICFIALIVCFRSLKHAYAVPSPGLPYRTLSTGNFNSLQREPAQINPKHYNNLVTSLLH
uniref:Uncharacterized protein n=1 Tax=Panagrolaimus davidi TaxID=227884 RepID=A0A914PPG7_9BILA